MIDIEIVSDEDLSNPLLSKNPFIILNVLASISKGFS
jgi:hypothetical protein